MAKTNAAFKEIDVKRALRGVINSGFKVTRIELDPASGRIILLTGTSAPSATPVSALDGWLEGKNGNEN